MNREQAKYHFMAVAPPCPPWFEPKYVLPPEPMYKPIPSHDPPLSLQERANRARIYQDWVDECNLIPLREKLLQWPAYYAEEMLKRAEP